LAKSVVLPLKQETKKSRFGAAQKTFVTFRTILRAKSEHFVLSGIKPKKKKQENRNTGFL